MPTNDPVQELADVLKSLNTLGDEKRKPNIWTIAERVRWLHLAVTSTRLDMQRTRGELDILTRRVERLARQVDRDKEEQDKI